jgi:ribonuclease BN (tRNA processing enzyme)
MRFSRRTVVTALAASGFAARAGALSPANPGTRLVLLGTAGGPRPRRSRSGSAQAIVVGDDIYLIDCGDGVARQMALAGLPLRQLRHIFLTHHHSDHNADFGTLLQLAWSSGLRTAVGCWGPPPTTDMVEHYLRYQSRDIALRSGNRPEAGLAPLVNPHDVTAGGPVMQDRNVRVTCAVVPHPPVNDSFAYRFDTRDRSIVISGDTAKSDDLVRLAAGADVLVHEVMFGKRVAEMLQSLPNHEAIARGVIAAHTEAEDVGRVAAAAKVKLLVLSHFVPAEDPTIADEEWIVPVRKHYSGRIVAGRDLMVL